MQFYNPNILYGLIAVAIPLIIHLFNFKRFRKVYFTNVAFLKNIQQQSKRHSQWRHIFVMILRMFFIVAIVIAFAGPYFPSKDKAKITSDISFVNVFLDNSFSMEARGTEGSLFEQGRLIAREIATNYKPSDKFRLLTNNKYSFSRNYVSRESFLNQLDNVIVEKSSLDFNRIPNGIIKMDEASKYQELFIISDFQKKQTSFTTWENDSLLEVSLIPLFSVDKGNVFVDSVWIDEPLLQEGQRIVVNIDIQNQSSKVIEDLAVSLYVASKKKAVLTTNIDAFASSKESFNIKLDSIGHYDARIKIDDYPVIYDDNFYFSYSVQKALDVLCISSKYANKDLHILLESDSSFNATIVSEESINYSNFSNYSTIILNSLSEYPSGLLAGLKMFALQGKNVIIIPSSNNSLEVINPVYSYFGLPIASRVDSTMHKMQNIDIESSEFNDIFETKNGKNVITSNTDLPYFKNILYSKVSRNPSITMLISNEAKNPLLFLKNIEGANIYAFYSAIESNNSNISSHAIFVPIMYSIIRKINSSNNNSLFLGSNINVVSSINTTSSVSRILMRHYTDSIEFIPQYRNSNGQLMLSFEQSPNTVGSYRFLIDDEQKSVYSFNYNRDESFLDYYGIDDLSNLLSELSLDNVSIMNIKNTNIAEHIQNVNNAIKLWKLFIIFALFFLIFELFLLRFSK
ncbi:MAG: BatA domain-containing protein [Bacteroidales bacterium]|nr:BatA domain-containing protein [Bacteroidales bacterium]